MLPVLFVPVFFAVPAVTYLGFWALSPIFSGTLSLAQPGDVGGVAFWAHAGGFVAGMILHVIFVRRGSSERRLARDEYGLVSAWVPSQHWRVS
jgi:membrane associated rhomboid family serine protease